MSTSSATTASTASTLTGTALLGLGAMGSALAGRLLDAGHEVTVWNRTPSRGADLVERGARRAASPYDAVSAHGLVVTCLLRHASVHETLDPVAGALGGRTLLDLTTTTPAEARELAAWAQDHDVTYLDGAVLAVPEMIGSPEAQVFCSGPPDALARHRDVLDVWGTVVDDGPHAGTASLVDLALLSAMYQMFAGFLHGAAMVGSAAMPAPRFAERATPFLAAMTEAFAEYAEVVDSGDWAAPGQQSLDFSDLTHLVRASREAGVEPTALDALQALISEQVRAGHGADSFPRVVEGMRAAG